MFLAVGSRLLPAPQSSAFSYRRQRDWWQKFRRPDENPTTCLDSRDHVPIRSWPLFKARNVLRTLFQSDFSLATR